MFDVMADEVRDKRLKVSVYVCDRFSQHKLVNEITYGMEIVTDEDAEERPSIAPVKINISERTKEEEVNSSCDREKTILFVCL